MKKTLEQVNKHFAERLLYCLDGLDWLNSRGLDWRPGHEKVNGLMTLELTVIPNWLRAKGVTNTTMFQYLPPHLSRALMYNKKRGGRKA